MAKRLRRPRTICSCCLSPPTSYSSRAPFSFYEDDVWIEISKYLGGKSLVKLGSTCKWFYKLMSEDCIWKYACLRDLGMPNPGNVSFRWQKIYASAFDGTHSYFFRQQEKYIEWMRIGAFFMDTPAALVTGKLSWPRRVSMDTIEKMLKTIGLCVLTNIKTGIWIADLQLVRCPVCNLSKCDGTMQMLDTRHFELFLNEGYQNGSWDYINLGSHETKKHANEATGAIFDLKHLHDASTTEVLKTKTWVGKQDDCIPKVKITRHAVAINTNLHQNEGLNVKFQVMRAGINGQIVAIRISQQLL
ncbi:putative F-box protein At3g61730 [Silene latifolia]|uniref:putative F-box protein At3g61730 n=1 Tax=Silene latifolia TaxID=37657 RepID=UPI003D770A16